MRVALYRVLYEQFLAKSIQSIDPFFDEIIVLLRDRPWGNIIPIGLSPWPRRSLHYALQNPKVRLLPFESDTPFNELTRFLNMWYETRERPGLLMFIEPDHVWTPSAWNLAHDEFVEWQDRKPGSVMCSAPIELWKTTHWRVPQRETRKGCVWWPMLRHPTIPETDTHADPAMGGMVWSEAKVHDFGFCVDLDVMSIKHELSLAYSPIIGDSAPDPAWLARWHLWRPGDGNLGISLGHADDIPYIEPYTPPQELLDLLELSGRPITTIRPTETPLLDAITRGELKSDDPIHDWYKDETHGA